jgi:hypothetical protein
VITLKGEYTSEMQALVEFITTQKFILKRAVIVAFMPFKTHRGCVGEFRSWDSGYSTTQPEVVVVCTKNSPREVLRTIIHEFKHVEQNHYERFPTQKELIADYINSDIKGFAAQRKKQVHLTKEKEARDWELPTLNEFLKTQEA